MQVLSKIKDHRINSRNLFVEATFGEYLSFAKKIKTNNELQRKRVRTSKTVYSLLKTDLERGCIIPPLVLAITEEIELPSTDPESQGDILLRYIRNHLDKVLILDGLQRTFTLIDADIEMSQKQHEEYTEFLNNTIRLEIYLDINKFGILYRMLTLNTGQTPMSTRHQLEMLYSDMKGTEIKGVTLISDVSGSADPNKKEFKFSDAIEGFNSYMSRSELPIDRQDMLESIKSLEHMANENMQIDLFRDFLECYIALFNALQSISGNYTLSKDDLEEAGVSESPFGKSAVKVFSTSQAMTGFGAAIGRMKDHGVASLQDIPALSTELMTRYDNTDYDWLLELLHKFDIIKATSKKIGNAQRMYFHYFFRELLNKESDSFLNLKAAVENGYSKYYSQVN